MSDFVAAPEQPTETMIYEADGLFAKQIVVKGAGVHLPQHAHKLSHLSLLAKGRVRICVDDVWSEYAAPCGIFIKAGAKHLFVTEDEETILYCIHALGTSEALKVLAEHQLLD